MIPTWVALALLSLPCNSTVEHQSNVTVAQQCTMPYVQGPPRPPLGWHSGIVEKPMAQEATKPVYNYKKKSKYKPKKKYKKKRRR